MVVARRGGLALTLADLGSWSSASASPTRWPASTASGHQLQRLQAAGRQHRGHRRRVKKAMDEVRKHLPPDVELRLIYASSDWVKGSLDGLKHTLIEGALLTVAIVFLFLHSWRSTIITGLTLPIAVISSFIAVYAFGFTLNFMTMMALSLCIGLLIDDAIVVRENIVRHVAMGKDHFTAAREGTDEIGLAVMATTFAIVRGVRAGGLHGRHHRQVLLPLRHHRGGGGAGQPVRQLHARPDAVQRLEGPAVAHLKKMWGIGHAIRATDRGDGRAARRSTSGSSAGPSAAAATACWCRRCRPTATASTPTARATRPARAAGAGPR
jgi:hypothetical protein